MRRLAGFLLILSCLLCLGQPQPAQAHPHVFVEARGEVFFDERGYVAGIRHRWTFDEAFSAYATQGLAASADGTFTRETLAPLARTNVENLRDYGYFTFAKLAGTALLFREPEAEFAEFSGGKLTLNFTLRLSSPQPMTGRSLALRIYDPTYFVDFRFPDSSAVTLANPPAGCIAQTTPRPDLTAEQQAETAGFDMSAPPASANGIGPGSEFANVSMVHCP